MNRLSIPIADESRSANGDFDTKLGVKVIHEYTVGRLTMARVERNKNLGRDLLILLTGAIAVAPLVIESVI